MFYVFLVEQHWLPVENGNDGNRSIAAFVFASMWCGEANNFMSDKMET